MHNYTYGQWQVQTEARKKTKDIAPREALFLRGIAAEKTQKQIAKDQNCSPSTVASGLNRLYYKLGVNSAKEAVRQAISAGILMPLCLMLVIFSAISDDPVLRTRPNRIQTRIIRTKEA